MHCDINSFSLVIPLLDSSDAAVRLLVIPMSTSTSSSTSLYFASISCFDSILLLFASSNDGLVPICSASADGGVAVDEDARDCDWD